MKHLLRSSIASFSLLGALLCGSQEAQAQFSTPTIDGVVNSTTEYSGNNYSSRDGDGTSPVWHVTWDANNVYFAVTNVSVISGSVVYIDSDPQPLVNGGTKANGNLEAFFNYDGIKGTLPFRADRAIYFKDGYQERRIANPDGNTDRNEGSWDKAEPDNGQQVGTYASRVYAPVDPNDPQNPGFYDYKVGAHEIAIPWTKINKDGSAGPKVFNWLGFITNPGVSPGGKDYGTAYGAVPFGNPFPGGTKISNSSPQFVRYFTEYNVSDGNINDTGGGTGGAAFFQNNSFTQIGRSSTNFGKLEVYDFTLNTALGTVNRDNNSGDWNIRGSLKVGNGTLSLGASNNPIFVDKDLIVYQSGTVQAGDAKIIVTKNFIIKGSFVTPITSSSILTLEGIGDTLQVPDRTFSLATLQLTGGNRYLTNNLNINTALILDGAVLNTGRSKQTNSNNTIFLAGGNNTSPARLDENNGGYVLGRIEASSNISSTGTKNFSGIGLTLVSRGGNYPGLVTARRITGVTLTSLTPGNSEKSVSRQYEVSVTSANNDQNLNLELQFNYSDTNPNELNGNTESALGIFKAPNEAGVYIRLGGDAIPAENVVTLGGLKTIAGFYALGSGITPLPVELASFSGQYANNSVLLKWTTASEKNNKGFGVERRVGEGSNWQQLAFVAGKSATGAAYSYVDATAPQGTSYYRLRQEDNDGTTAYSPVVAVLVAGQAAGTLALSPVPTTDQLTISGFGAGQHVAEVYDLRGRRVLTQEISNAQATLSVSTLPSGVYLVRVQGAGAAQKGKFVKL